MTRYAESTSVSSANSRNEIERTLARYGANEFCYMTNPETAVIAFRIDNRRVKLILDMPNRDDEEFTLTPTGRERSENQSYTAWEQACRQRWRALALVIKAKLEWIKCGGSDFETEFMADVMLPNGSTVGEFMKPQIAWAYETQEMPELIPGLSRNMLPANCVEAEVSDAER